MTDFPTLSETSTSIVKSVPFHKSETFRRPLPVGHYREYTSGPKWHTVEPLCATTSRKRLPIQNTKIFPAKALQLEPLVNDHPESCQRPRPLFGPDGLMIFHSCFTSCKRPLDAFSDLYVRCVHYAVKNIRRTLVRTWNYTWHNLDIARGGTRYILGWGCAARPLIPWLCLRQKSLIFLPCLSRQNSNFWYLV